MNKLHRDHLRPDALLGAVAVGVLMWALLILAVMS